MVRFHRSCPVVSVVKQTSIRTRRHVGRAKPDHTRSVELRAVTRPYPVTIGVVGANGLDAGAFYLRGYGY